MVRTEDETSSFASKKLSNCFDFIEPCILIRDHMVQPEHQNSIRICQYPFVERKLEPSLIDALKHRDNMPCSLTYKLLKRHPGPEKQFQRSCDPLLELVRPLRR